jgi:hypothetical protein
MKAKILLIALVFLVSTKAYSYNWDEIADSIASQQRGITEEEFHSKIETYKRIRKTQRIKMHYDSTFTVGDTIIMEYHNPYKGATHSALWVKGSPQSFMTYNRHFDIYMRNLPHSHSGNADFIYGRQWNVMKRLGYDYLESTTGKIFRQ